MEEQTSINKKIENNVPLIKPDILHLIRLLRTKEKEWIFQTADRIREKKFGGDIFIRGIIEFSNICRRSCDYCGIRSLNSDLQRYRMTEEEILSLCRKMEKWGHSTVVLQSGEDLFYSKERMGALIRQIKKETSLAVTLSVGEREHDIYQYWYECGMNRYLLRFETSSESIFSRLHPDDNYHQRMNCIKDLNAIGVQTGSGFMIGLPDASDETLAEDILLCRELDLDMIGVGPFIPHPDTPLGTIQKIFNIDFLSGIISILRIVCQDAHIPATTAFDAVHPNGRDLVLQRGANIFMPNVTPLQYRRFYQLYPGKPCIDESSEECNSCVRSRIQALGRSIGQGQGHSLHKKRAIYPGSS